MKRAIGIDLSEWDLRPLDWERARELLSFVFIKISQGTNPDPLFRAQWIAAEGYILRGLYHMLDPYDDIDDSVDKTIELYKAVSPGELPPVLDLELGAAPIELPRARRWLERWETKTGIEPMIYTSLGFLDQEHLKLENKWLSNYPLWLAGWPYDNMSEAERKIRIGQILRGEIVIPYPAAPRPWSLYPEFYQWTSRGDPADIPGYYMGMGHKKAVDINYFHGTEEDLFLKYGRPRKAPQNGENNTMPYNFSITPSTSYGSKIRTDHYVVDSPIPNRIGSLAENRFAFGNEKWISPAGATEDEAAEVWLHVLSVNGDPLEGWIAAKHKGVRYAYISPIETGEEQEVPETSVDLSVNIEADLLSSGLLVKVTASSPGFAPGSVSFTLPRE